MRPCSWCRAAMVGAFSSEPSAQRVGESDATAQCRKRVTRLTSFAARRAAAMQLERCVAGAALLIDECRNHRPALGDIHRTRRSPTAEKLESCWLDSKLGGAKAAARPEETGPSGS